VPVNTALIPGLGATKINPIDGAEMVYVPAGEFTMGANDLRNAPEHRVYLDKYWIYKAPVTVAQYKASCAATKREMPDAPNWGWISDHPVVKVTWADATAYCEWAGVRLPTEAQWEKASRGTDARAFPWGNRWDGSRCANSAGRNNLSSTKPVRSYALGVSPCGALDMAGNVWEWCADWYGDYEARDLVRNPAGPKSGGARLLRGGAWSHAHGVNFRCAYRYFSEPTGRDGDDGFRCAGTELHFSH